MNTISILRCTLPITKVIVDDGDEREVECEPRQAHLVDFIRNGELVRSAVFWTEGAAINAEKVLQRSILEVHPDAIRSIAPTVT